MSEYQYYEFVAVDRSLTPEELRQLREVSTRADIGPRSFRNEYNYGSLRADPAQLLAKYFDGFLYYANWGSPRLMFRLPADRCDLRSLKTYLPGGLCKATKRGKFIILEFSNEFEEPDECWHEPSLLGSLISLRNDIACGDMSLPYLGWLINAQNELIGDAKKEPPVPAGLAKPGPALQAAIEFLGVDGHLLCVAAKQSPAAPARAKARDLWAWVQKQPVKTKDAWLRQLVDDPTFQLGTEIRRLHAAQTGTPTSSTRRSAGQLRQAAEDYQLAQERAELRAEQKRIAAREAEHERHLRRLQRSGKRAWDQVDDFVADKAYEEAASRIAELRAGAEMVGRLAAFETRFADFENRYKTRRALLRAVKRELES